MRVGADPGRDAQLHALQAPVGHEPVEQVDVGVVVDDDVADAGRHRLAQLGLDFALPCRWILAGSKPAFSAIASSPPEATSQARPSSRRIRRTAVHGKALEAKWTSKSSQRAA